MTERQSVPSERKVVTSVTLERALVDAIDAIVKERNAPLVSPVWNRSAVVAEAIALFLPRTGDSVSMTYAER